MRALRVCTRGHHLGDGLLVPSIKLACWPCTAMKTKNGGGEENIVLSRSMAGNCHCWQYVSRDADRIRCDVLDYLWTMLCRLCLWTKILVVARHPQHQTEPNKGRNWLGRLWVFFEPDDKAITRYKTNFEKFSSGWANFKKYPRSIYKSFT